MQERLLMNARLDKSKEYAEDLNLWIGVKLPGRHALRSLKIGSGLQHGSHSWREAYFLVAWPHSHSKSHNNSGVQFEDWTGTMYTLY
jgi:hypothetical protein